MLCPRVLAAALVVDATLVARHPGMQPPVLRRKRRAHRFEGAHADATWSMQHSDRVADTFWSLVLMAAQGTTVGLEGCAPNSEPKMLGSDMPVAVGSISIGRRLLHSCRSNPSAHHCCVCGWSVSLPAAIGSPRPGDCPQPAARRRAGRARGSLAPGPRAGAAQACRIAQPSPPRPCRPGARSACPLHSPNRLPNSKRCAKACQKTRQSVSED